MGRGTNKLTDRQCRTAKPPEGKQQLKLTDGGGLVLLVKSNGGKQWQFRYRRPSGREATMGLGVYPDVPLSKARERRDEARALLADGIDPIDQRKAQRSAAASADTHSFEAVAREWWDAVHRHKVVASHANRNLRRLEQYAFPKLGRRPVSAIEPPDVLEALRRIEALEHVETAHRVKTLIGQVCRYAIATGRGSRDPTADLRGMLRSPKTRHLPAITEPAELGPLLRAIDGYRGQPTTRAALQLAPIVFCRPGELRAAEWQAFDLSSGTWDYQPSKDGDPLVTPLPRQAISILRELEPISRSSRYLFPSGRTPDRPISDNTLTAALKRLDYGGRMVAHGFRAAARTILVERLGWGIEIVEMQLGHRVRDAHGRAYNRTQWIEQRGVMLQQWADYLDELREASDTEPTADRDR
ncbi:tyrosine-type recombinase/integrase [Halorhodospira halophila]|uniref:Phage integrase family protein n=1 Tax=Halorhodospira halophila (strain DSM 244 / SL1) TaxID=349124 RepID=A1WW57_HALHL|nr:integrase arm-type DNA-binding domain-containing protein [Halorhodospira halophila]ABM61919.1 phage integrase family protein [Halorhodospira halophila SL1]MBK1729750.1 integrase [Halorhodospira halophila]